MPKGLRRIQGGGDRHFNVYSQKKHMEKLRYMHRNPVTRGLVASAELSRWSSFQHYRYGEAGPVKIGE